MKVRVEKDEGRNDVCDVTSCGRTSFGEVRYRKRYCFLARGFDPFLLERVLGRTIGFVKHSEDAGERELRELVGGELVGDVVTEFVLGRVVPFSFLDQFEAAAFLRIGWIEYVREKFDALDKHSMTLKPW